MIRQRKQPAGGAERSQGPARPPSWTMEFGRSSALGITFAATFLTFAGLGYLVDRWIGTYPLFLALGLLLGAAGGFIKLVYTVFPRPFGKPGDEPADGSGKTSRRPPAEGPGPEEDP